MNNSQVAHEWAHGRDRRYSGQNMYAENGVIYSYGKHFPMAKFYGANREIVLTTSHGYSSSTARHLSYVRNAIPRGTKTFRVDAVCGSGGIDLSKVQHKQNHKKMVEVVAEFVKASKAPRNRPGTIAANLASAEAARLKANAYRAAFKLGGRDLASIGIAADHVEAAMRAAARAAARAEKVATEAKLRSQDENFAKWFRGGFNGVFPGRPVAFRFRRNGTERIIETSLGAQFSARDALAAYPRLVELRALDARYVPDVSSDADSVLRISGFNVSSVAPDGVIVGCHNVSWDAVDDLARKLGAG